ncbi:sugar phosphate nucleotidyltransferase [Gammaproteobacteria bacterium]|jgi:glucose-1-phosphate thymidylyltransferase|nr:sugar phosphate nucleotidyltransferase [Gammaproteobacteria bacterium]
MKGIILAGGHGTRLYPATISTSKQLLPIYDKPLIFYPLVTLMEAGIRDIAIITKKKDRNNFKSLLGDGSNFGIRIQYFIQDDPRGLAEAFIITEKFIGKSDVTLILGDNIFYGESLGILLKETFFSGARIFCSEVQDPERYGVLGLKNNSPVSIIEKPAKFISKWAVTGLYVYDSSVINQAKLLTPSKRGELEITDLNQKYLTKKILDAKFLDSNIVWMDTGTFDSMHEASSFVAAIQKRQAGLIGSPELTAYKNKWITKSEIKKNIRYSNQYTESLLRSL